MLLSPSAGLLRFSQKDIAQIATVVVGLIWPLPQPRVGLSSSLSAANPLQVLFSLSSSTGSNSSLVPTLPSSTMLQSRPGTETVIGTLCRICWVRIRVGQHTVYS